MPPSPNLPSAASTLLYPGTCFAEGVNVAEGRTTAVPFRVIAAPFIDGEALATRIRQLGIPGIAAVPYGFVPHARDHAGIACEGVLLHVTDPDRVRPVSAGVRVLAAIAEQVGDALEERRWPDMPGESNATPLERLFGRPGAFDEIVAGEWNDPDRFLVPEWAERVQPDLLYR